MAGVENEDGMAWSGVVMIQAAVVWVLLS